MICPVLGGEYYQTQKTFVESRLDCARTDDIMLPRPVFFFKTCPATYPQGLRPRCPTVPRSPRQSWQSSAVPLFSTVESHGGSLTCFLSFCILSFFFLSIGITIFTIVLFPLFLVFFLCHLIFFSTVTRFGFDGTGDEKNAT